MTEAPPSLRSLFVVPSLAGGGAERCALEVCKGLDPRQFERHLLPFVHEGEYSAELSADLVAREARAGSSGPAGRLPRLLRKWLLPAVQLARAIRRIGPDVVVTFLPEASLPASLVRWLRPDLEFVWVISEQNATRRRVLETNPDPWRRWLLDRWIRRAYGAADRVVAVSAGVKQGLVDDYGLDERRISVIFNPVDRARVRSDAARALPRPWAPAPFVVAMGRLTKQKGLDILLRAFAIVRREQRAGLVILGEGEEGVPLAALARELGIAADVHFLGFQANPWPYVSQARVFALPSRWEGCPLVLAEAMACETAVVAADCDYGPRELIEHGDNGLLVPPEDPEALAKALLQLLADPGRAALLGSRGGTRARELDVSVIAGRYGRLFRRLVRAG